MSSGAIIIQRRGDVQIVEFITPNILDQLLIERIKEELVGVVEQSGLPRIIISFDNVKHVSSAMLGTLMAINKRTREAHGELRLAGINKQLMEVFKLTRLDKVLKIYPGVEEAMVKFGS